MGLRVNCGYVAPFLIGSLLPLNHFTPFELNRSSPRLPQGNVPGMTKLSPNKITIYRKLLL